MIWLPSHSQTGFFVFRHTPRHGIAEGSHTVLLDIIATEIHQRKIHKAADGDVCSLVDLSLTAVDSQLPRYRSVEPAIWNPGVSTGKRATELGVKSVSCRCPGRSLARRPCSQVPHGHLCVPKGSSGRSSARHPSPQVRQSHLPVAKGSSGRSLARRPRPQVPQCHPRVSNR